jgi:CDP-diacylglycerol---serine O-phosphatidyltransferase
MSANETKPPHRGLKKGLYLIPTLFTAANVAMGYLAVLWSIRGFQAVGVDPSLAAGYFDSAGLAIGLAILFDTIDGRVARATRTATEIGVQFDSLADVLTFGIAPAAIVYGWAIAPVFPENSPGHNLGVFLLFAYLMCGAFRLARFNLQATRPRVLIEGATKVDKKAFVGLPIPPAGGLLASLVHFSPMPLSTQGGAASQVYVYLLMGLVAALAVLMVSTFRYTSMKGVEKGRQAFLLIVLLAGVAMAVWFYSRYALLAIAAVYVSHGVVWWFIRFLGRFRAPATSDQAV